MNTGQFYINGSWVNPLEQETFDVINPATERSAAKISMAGTADVELAVQAARSAFPEYMATTVEQRLGWFSRLL